MNPHRKAPRFTVFFGVGLHRLDLHICFNFWSFAQHSFGASVMHLLLSSSCFFNFLFLATRNPSSSQQPLFSLSLSLFSSRAGEDSVHSHNNEVLALQWLVFPLFLSATTSSPYHRGLAKTPTKGSTSTAAGSIARNLSQPLLRSCFRKAWTSQVLNVTHTKKGASSSTRWQVTFGTLKAKRDLPPFKRDQDKASPSIHHVTFRLGQAKS
ncbi:hypothetical protein PIB30_073867 [Stylosanthes scabra]|uniref:Transmembrane protein n=1 Tax=Stylosanthes scabra TaxID=79078 RepID=A0ABU6SQE7_9FABA|nr:hypothetical protein [Stylosanthes scabra]